MSIAQWLPGDLGLFAWRATIQQVIGDDTPDVVLISGGDWYPQVVQVYPGVNGSFDVSKAWATTDSGFHSQGRLADLGASPGLELITATYQGLDLQAPLRARGAGLRVYSNLISGGRGAGVDLLCGVAVNDFELVDANHDGLLDLYLATTGRDPSDTCGSGASTAAAPRRPDVAFLAPHSHLDAPVGGTEMGLVQLDTKAGTGTKDPLLWPYVGVYLNQGTRAAPRFGREPDWWAAWPQKGVPSADASVPGRPSRVAVADLNQDGWLDYVATFMSRATVVWYGGRDLGTLPKKGATLSAQEPEGTWASALSPAMTNDVSVFFLPEAEGKLAGWLVEARGCTPPETFCKGCGIPTGTELGDGCSTAGPDCNACLSTCDTHGELLAHTFPEERTVSLRPPGADIVLSVGARAFDDQTPGVVYGVGSDPSASRLLATPLVAGATPTDLLGTNTFPIALLPFGGPAGPTVTLSTTLGAGPSVSLPGLVAPRVDEVKLRGRALPSCGPSAPPCWTWSARSRAVTVLPPSPGAKVGVRYTPQAGQDLLVVQPDPLAQSLVLTPSAVTPPPAPPSQ